jgi:hypothetical protein
MSFSTAANGMLSLWDPENFSGHISGFAPSDEIDLAFFPNATILGYTTNANHTAGALSIDLNGDATTDTTFSFYGDYAQGNFFTVADGFGGTFIQDHAPVISTANVSFDTGTSTLSGLAISDSFINTSSDHMMISAVADHGTLTPHGTTTNVTVVGGGTSVLSGEGLLSDINNMLTDGITYAPTLDGNNEPPQTDHIRLAIADNHGAIDGINFIFNVAGQTDSNGNISLTGTSGKDVIYNTSVGNNAGGTTDTLTGGENSDTFVFRNFSPMTQHNDVVADFNFTQDFLNFDTAHFADVAALLAHAHADSNNAANTVITVDQHNTVTLNNVTTAQLDQHQSHIIIA